MTNQPPSPDPSQSPFPPGPPGYPAAPPVQKKSKVGLIVALVVVGLLAVCGIGGTLVVLALKPAAEKAEQFAKSISELKEGDCVKPANVPDQYLGSSCSADETIGKVIKTFPGTEKDGQTCPPQSDLLLHEAGTIACVRSTTDKHEGEPGQGGGVFVAGDCVGAGPIVGNSREYTEVACTDPKVYERVVARATTPAGCTAPAVRFLQIALPKQDAICLADGPGIAGPGECVGKLSGETTFDAVPCSAPTAGGKVLARKPTQAACEKVPGLTHYIEDSDGLPASRFLCIKEV